MLNTVQSLAITLSIKTISLTSPPNTLSMLNHFFSLVFALFFFLLQSQQNYLCFLCLFLCSICSIRYASLLSRFLSAADPHYLTSLVLPSSHMYLFSTTAKLQFVAYFRDDLIGSFFTA